MLAPCVSIDALCDNEPKSSNGNVQLNDDGTVDVFLIGIIHETNLSCGRWMSVCDMNSGAAEAVCRQMGHNYNGPLSVPKNE